MAMAVLIVSSLLCGSLVEEDGKSKTDNFWQIMSLCNS